MEVIEVEHRQDQDIGLEKLEKKNTKETISDIKSLGQRITGCQTRIIRIRAYIADGKAPSLGQLFDDRFDVVPVLTALGIENDPTLIFPELSEAPVILEES